MGGDTEDNQVRAGAFIQALRRHSRGTAYEVYVLNKRVKRRILIPGPAGSRKKERHASEVMNMVLTGMTCEPSVIRLPGNNAEPPARKTGCLTEVCRRRAQTPGEDSPHGIAVTVGTFTSLGCGTVSASFFIVEPNPKGYTDPDGKAILATSIIYNLFHNKNINANPIGNNYNTPFYHTQSHLQSSIAYYPQWGRGPVPLTRGGNNRETQAQINTRAIGPAEARKFSVIADKYANAIADGKEISFSSAKMEGKIDSNDTPYYELSLNIEGENVGSLFYYSGMEGRTRDRVLNLVGDLFSSIKDGNISEWKPSTTVEVKGETPFD
jgi:hypothetical protein